MKQDLSADVDIAVAPEPQRGSFMADDTPPWDDSSGAGTSQWSGPSDDWKGKTAEPVFDIDLPPGPKTESTELAPYSGHRVGRARTHNFKME